MNVPFCDLARLTRLIAPAVLADWASQLEEADFIDGAAVHDLEAALAARLGVPHVVSCANGTDALVLGLRALGVGHGAGHAVVIRRAGIADRARLASRAHRRPS